MSFLDLKITEKNEQKLLSRIEVQAILGFTGSSTPSNEDVKNAIAKEVGKDAKLVVIQHIYTNYGDTSAKVIAHVYDNDKKLDEIENTHKKSKKKEGEEGEAAPAQAAPAAEAPKEEKKEEVKEAPKEEKKEEEKKE